MFFVKFRPGQSTLINPWSGQFRRMHESDLQVELGRSDFTGGQHVILHNAAAIGGEFCAVSTSEQEEHLHCLRW